MMRKLLLASSALFLPVLAHAACTSAVPNYAASAGGFGVIDGQMYAPDGTVFSGRGVAVMYDGSAPSASEIQSEFNGTNLVRLAIYSEGGVYPTGAELQSYVDDLTSHGIFVVIEDHSNSSGDDAGGGQGVIFQGSMLQTQQAAYQDWATTFKTDPYVGFGTDNEPSDKLTTNGPDDPAALANWDLQTYNTIRDAGNNNPIFIEPIGYSPQTANVGFPQSVFSQMTDVAWDWHPYGGAFGMSTDPSTISSDMATTVANLQAVTSADGTMPVFALEYGDSTSGTGLDPNGMQTVAAVQQAVQSGLLNGSTAWAWGSGPAGTDSLLSGSGLSAFGQAVASYVAGSGSTGCPASPLPTPIVSQAMTDAQDAVTVANNLSVSDVANLAAQGLTADGQSINATAQLSTDPGTTQPGQIATLVLAPVRTVSSPTGTTPAPAPVSNSLTFSADGDYQTVVPTAGNATGTVTGTGNTINATGGIQTITVTGSGNTVTTGVYNDTVTVQSGGNTINTGGGNDTIVLAYPGQTAPIAINADAPALPPLAGAGNVFVVPAPGTGVLTIQGTLASGDQIDLTKALAGTTWDGDASSMWNYVEAATSPTGCVISVGGVPVLKLPNGSPSGDIGSFIVARAG